MSRQATVESCWRFRSQDHRSKAAMDSQVSELSRPTLPFLPMRQQEPR
jgi:hypothetical protein